MPSHVNAHNIAICKLKTPRAHNFTVSPHRNFATIVNSIIEGAWSDSSDEPIDAVTMYFEGAVSPGASECGEGDGAPEADLRSARLIITAAMIDLALHETHSVRCPCMSPANAGSNTQNLRKVLMKILLSALCEGRHLQANPPRPGPPCWLLRTGCSSSRGRQTRLQFHPPQRIRRPHPVRRWPRQTKPPYFRMGRGVSTSQYHARV